GARHRGGSGEDADEHEEPPRRYAEGRGVPERGTVVAAERMLMTVRSSMTTRSPETAGSSATAPWSAAAIADALGQPRPTPEQTAVIEAGLEPMLVVAGAGSGKTETMAARVVYLV